MIHNFKSEIKKQDINSDIKEFLLELYQRLKNEATQIH